MALKELLGKKYVKRLLVARFISNFGNGMGPIAISFGILHLENGSASMIGWVLGSQAISMIVMSPFGGVLADKFGRIRMVAVCDIWGSVGLIVQAYYFSTGHVPLAVMLIANINFGLMAGMWWPAFSGVLPSIVGDETLQKGNGVISFVSNGAMISGAAAAGFLISTFGSATSLAIDAFSFTISGIILATMAHLNPPREPNEASVLDDLRHGWKVFLSYRWIVVVVFGFSFIVMAWSIGESVIGPMISLKHFNGPKSWSLVIACESVGYLVGAIIGYRIKVKYPMRFLMITTWSISAYMWSLAGPQPLLFIAFTAFLWGVCLDLWGTIWSTAMVRQVPREALSRVAAFDAMGSFLLRPVGLLVAGPLIGWIGLTHSAQAMAAFTAVIVALVLLSPDVRNMQMPTSTESNLSQ